MAGVKYILDTNVIADYINKLQVVETRLKQAIIENDYIYLCQPVHYEVLRGLFKTSATRKQQIYEHNIVPVLNRLPLIDADWRQAARLWADARNKGKQLADTDLLIAALAIRIDGIVVTADDDFDALPIQRTNWRITK